MNGLGQGNTDCFISLSLLLLQLVQMFCHSSMDLNQDQHTTEGYRPISLLNTMSKIIEKMVNNRLIWYLEKHNLLSPHQHGFRKNRSTNDILVSLHTDIADALVNKQNIILVSLDLKKAYDTVWRHRVLKIIQKLNIHGNMLKFINNHIRERTFQVKIKSTLSDPFANENGVVQGSSISVTLFLIAINEMTTQVPPPTMIKLFADDALIYCKGKNVSSIKNQLQLTLDKLSKWSLETGFSFSPNKTKCILFTHQRKIVKPNIQFENKTLDYSDNVKILGLIFDKKLNW
ncbi:unnamed protein product [Macrosiphum euphorbiae]|uniref:Reverse transcriptase domain-containing protein n=1 Tax=Macrosiphum euphorbiae TaxID=13131 RepID=A0AAV0WUB5_9HEMI|nr:unnamed protein product [Macrosiphum euphorbiae]